MLTSNDCNDNTTADMVGTLKLEQMVNKEQFQKIMEQSCSKFIFDQMKQDFNMTKMDNTNKQIDGIFHSFCFYLKSNIIRRNPTI